MKESVDTSCLMSSIGNSGARSSGPTGASVPGCSGGGGGEGRSGITLYHCRGISDSSSTILVRSLTRSSLKSSQHVLPVPYAAPAHPTRAFTPCGASCVPFVVTRVRSGKNLPHEGLHGRGQLLHRLLRVGEVHGG